MAQEFLSKRIAQNKIYLNRTRWRLVNLQKRVMLALIILYVSHIRPIRVFYTTPIWAQSIFLALPAAVKTSRSYQCHKEWLIYFCSFILSLLGNRIIFMWHER
jgi:hypothetical protein